MGKLMLLSPLSPPSQSRAWSSAPHPTLPLVATASSDKTVRIYSLLNFKLHSTLEGGHKRSVRVSAWKPNTKGELVIATGSFDASCGIWRRWDGNASSLMTGEEEFLDEATDEDNDTDWQFSVVLDGHDSEIKSVAWSAGGSYLATCSRDKSVWIWEELEADEFETIAVLTDHEADVKCVIWHPEEELLASGSYDDTIRLYKEDLDDWTCVSILRGHKSTVWTLDFEGMRPPSFLKNHTTPAQQQWISRRATAGPRLISGSADGSLKVWRRIPKVKADEQSSSSGRRIPSIIRSSSAEQEWICETSLPNTFDREIYSVAWSRQTGYIVACGGDGKLVVFGERWRDRAAGSQESRVKRDVVPSRGDDVNMEDADDHVKTGDEPSTIETNLEEVETETEWKIVAEIEGAHGVFEVNHVAWSKRWDKGRRHDEEEIIISTGDDGDVRLWTLTA